MSFLDKVGKMAMDAIDSATRVAGKVQSKVDPLIEKSELATRLRERIVGRDDDFAAPDPENNDSPFESAEAEEAPLGKPQLPAQVFGRGTDPWTGRTLQLLADRQVEHEFVDLEAEGGLKIHSQLVRETKQNEAPYVFLRGEFIGGFNALSEIERLGQLEARLDPNQTQGRVRIVIPTRREDERPAGEIGNPDDRK
ncbi:MAG TPA: glutaredoxin [Polyangiaceae bacterium]|nr:glutaredoxin [Polyangiaceae bacterium]